MSPPTKIATCSYCGRRAALQLTARGGHEMACGACGAPLHEMKWLKPPTPDQPRKRSIPAPAPHAGPVAHQTPRPTRPVKRRKAFWKKAMSEVFDLIEDMFD
ncbi:MAG: hypothetical protein RLZZ491_2546 [Pseudomonadota bacterium]|jgi:hypothetical protein